MKPWQVNAGDTVVCDICNRDYTFSKERGGIISEGYAFCPKCEKHVRLSDVEYISRPNESYRDFILRVRKQCNLRLYSY